MKRVQKEDNPRIAGCLVFCQPIGKRLAVVAVAVIAVAVLVTAAGAAACFFFAAAGAAARSLVTTCFAATASSLVATCRSTVTAVAALGARAANHECGNSDETEKCKLLLHWKTPFQVGVFKLRVRAVFKTVPGIIVKNDVYSQNLLTNTT